MLVNWWWNGFLGKISEIIESIEGNKGFCAKVDDKKKVYSTNGSFCLTVMLKLL